MARKTHMYLFLVASKSKAITDVNIYLVQWCGCPEANINNYIHLRYHRIINEHSTLNNHSVPSFPSYVSYCTRFIACICTMGLETGREEERRHFQRKRGCWEFVSQHCKEVKKRGSPSRPKKSVEVFLRSDLPFLLQTGSKGKSFVQPLFFLSLSLSLS